MENNYKSFRESCEEIVKYLSGFAQTQKKIDSLLVEASESLKSVNSKLYDAGNGFRKGAQILKWQEK